MAIIEKRKGGKIAVRRDAYVRAQSCCDEYSTYKDDHFDSDRIYRLRNAGGRKAALARAKSRFNRLSK